MWFLFGVLAGIPLGAVLAAIVILWFTIPRLERLYVFRPSKDVLKTPADLGIPYEQCFIDTRDGCRLAAWHLSPENPVGSVIYFHGSTGNLGILSEMLAMFYRNGLQVLAVDYRGYGWSTGAPSEQGVYEDAVATVEYFEANFKKFRVPVVYWGRSLGGCIASFASKQLPPNGLILETTFPSKASLLEEYPQLRRFNLFARYRLETATFLNDHQFPVLILHGDRDRTVPLRQGQILYNQLSGPKEFWTVPGAGHIDIHMVDSQRYMQKVLGFVTSVQPPLVH
jgi:pimeloyl-ACP methyl ester carboxylesterase